MTWFGEKRTAQLESVETTGNVTIVDKKQGVLLSSAEQLTKALDLLANAPVDAKKALNANAFQYLHYGNPIASDEGGVNPRRLEYHMDDQAISRSLSSMMQSQKGSFSEIGISLAPSPDHVFSSMDIAMAKYGSNYYVSVHDNQWRQGENPDAYMARQMRTEQCLLKREFHIAQPSDGRSMIVNQPQILEKITSILPPAFKPVVTAQFAEYFSAAKGRIVYPFVARIHLAENLDMMISLPGAKSQDAWTQRTDGKLTIPYNTMCQPEVVISLQHRRSGDYTGQEYPVIDNASLGIINQLSPQIALAFSV